MNFIQKYCLNKRLNAFIPKRKGEQTSIYTLKEANSICFFITLDAMEKLSELIECVSSFKDKKIVIICYLNGEELPESIDTSLVVYAVSKKDVSIMGRVAERLQEKIFSQRYNLFIDMDTKQDLMPLFLKTFLNADFRIGRNEKYYDYFDFVLCADEQCSMKKYILNLEKYISKLKGN